MVGIDRHLLSFLVNALWQVPLAAAATAVVCRLMRNGPARHRHAAGVAGLIAAVLLPAASLWRAAPEQAITVVPHQLTTAAAPPLAPQSSEPPRTVPVPRTAANLGLWALGLFLLYRTARLLAATIETVRICRSAVPSTRPCAIWERCRDAFGIHDAELRWSRSATGPVTAGRVVIVPESMAAAADDILTAAIGHEAAHIARRDFAANVACELLALPISFHPATAWLRREIAGAREMACDELVTARLVAPDAYARSIVSIAATLAGLGRPGYTLGVLDGDILEQRVRRLLARPEWSLKRARLMLAAGVAILAACVAIASGLAVSARAQTPVQQQMRTAADAYNSGDFAEAARRFEQAVEIDSADLNARLFLANTYLRLKRSDLAAAQYREVLSRDPQNIIAISGVVSINGMDSPQESRELLERAIAVDAKDPRAYYSIGVLDWGAAYKAVAALNGGPGPDMYRRIADPATRANVRHEIGPSIEEGFRMLQMALALDPGWSEPMAYMNLLLRVNSALVDDPAESAKLIARADEWVGKAIQARKAQPRTDVRIDADGPPPSAIPSVMPAPPPPPPPPGGFRGNGDGK